MFVCLNEFFVNVINYTSKYFEIPQLPNASSDIVITHMRSIFARHGKSKVVFIDNGPQYCSHGFNKFSKSWTELLKLLKKPSKNAERIIVTLALHITKNRSGTSTYELRLKKKLETLVPLLNVNVNTKTKLKKPTLSQY